MALCACVFRAQRASGFDFGAGHLIDILRGNSSEKILQRGHEKLTTFGIGSALGEPEWRGVFANCVAFGYLTVDHEGFGSLVLTEQSKPVLKGERNVHDAPLCEADAHASIVRGTSERADPTIGMAAQTRALDACGHGAPKRRRATACRRVYVIFHDATLAEIAQRGPTRSRICAAFRVWAHANSTVSATNCWKSSPPTDAQVSEQVDRGTKHRNLLTRFSNFGILC